MNRCCYCQIFAIKVCRHPVKPNKVPKRCWEETFVDLFEPLLSNNHIAVIQGLVFHYPIPKPVKSINESQPLLYLKMYVIHLEIRIDNGPPFNSKEMENITKNRNITQVKTLPGHPSHDNVETVMKLLGKAMKVGQFQNQGGNGTLSSFLVNYGDTPHFATGVSPA